MKLTKEQAKELKDKIKTGLVYNDSIYKIIDSMTEQEPIKITEQSILEFNGNKYFIDEYKYEHGVSDKPTKIMLRIYT